MAYLLLTTTKDLAYIYFQVLFYVHINTSRQLVDTQVAYYYIFCSSFFVYLNYIFWTFFHISINKCPLFLFNCCMEFIICYSTIYLILCRWISRVFFFFFQLKTVWQQIFTIIYTLQLLYMYLLLASACDFTCTINAFAGYLCD